MPKLEVPIVNFNVCHAWHLYVLKLNLERLTINRAQFIEALCHENIGASVHFIPVHLHPYYQYKYHHEKGDLRRTEEIYERIISLPLYSKMEEQDVLDVIDAVRRIVSQHAR